MGNHSKQKKRKKMIDENMNSKKGIKSKSTKTKICATTKTILLLVITSLVTSTKLKHKQKNNYFHSSQQKITSKKEVISNSIDSSNGSITTKTYGTFQHFTSPYKSFLSPVNIHSSKSLDTKNKKP